MNDLQIKTENAIQSVISFCERDKFIGYSLYDSHNSPVPFTKFGKKISFLVNQVNKRSPFNFRPILGIKKGINPKGYGLFLHSFSLLFQLGIIFPEDAMEKADYFFQWLQNNPSKGYSGYCWGYNYHWPKKDGSDVPAYTPSVVVTGFVARALLAYYEARNNEEAKELLKSMTKFVLEDVHLYKGQDGYCFSYTPVKKDLTVNANLLAAEVLAYYDFVAKENNFSEYIENVIQFTLNMQNKDGSWYYSFDYETRQPKKQIDFHQGYVLESLLRLSQYSRITNPSLKDSLNKGLRYYYQNQFDNEGRAFWRYPSKWPIDIHNQSQGIIVFSKFKDYNNKYLTFAGKIAEWTILNMQGIEGNFYYQKWPALTNKVNYLRWNQAWMLLALTTYLSSVKDANTN